MDREIAIYLRKSNENPPSIYPANQVSSTKYNRWNFLPIALF